MVSRTERSRKPDAIRRGIIAVRFEPHASETTPIRTVRKRPSAVIRVPMPERG
jgi:hypothetical protein